MEDTFKAEGFHLLGFLSNDFGNQGGTGGQIDMCNAQYGIMFEQFALDHVSGADAQPVYSWLFSQPNVGPSASVEPVWNFHKYLISRDGQLVGHWDSAAYPGDNPSDPNDSFDTSEIVVAIQAELAK